MSGGLLLLSFHTGSLFHEDLLFKKSCMDKHGLASPLVTHDILADQAPPPTSLVAVDASGGLAKASNDGVKAWTLGSLKTETWRRKGFRPAAAGLRSDFQTWFDGILGHPAEVIVVGGHHGGLGSGLNRSPIFWGAEHSGTGGYYPQSGIAAQVADGKPHFTVTAYRRADGEDVVRTPFDATRAASACRMVVVLGCSGVDLGDLWQAWVRVAHPQQKRPLVLGWYGTHSMPKRPDPNFSSLFWDGVYAAARTTGSTTLSSLIDRAPESVVKAWGQALKVTYKGHPRRSHLWFWIDAKKAKEGAGAVTPDGRIWKVTEVNGDIQQV